MDLNVTQRRLLMLLKMQGPQTGAKLAMELGISHEGVRLPMQKLMELGLVRTKTESGAVGRPKAFYQLTAGGHDTFPDTHSDLALQLLSSVSEVLGQEALDRLIAAREKQITENYTLQLAGLDALELKLEKLVHIRSREGYMAEWYQEEDHFLFIENHCPICSVAEACGGFCGAELNTFHQVLGDGVQVERVEHIVKGGRRCAYRIHPNR